jgi:hypothetical protein
VIGLATAVLLALSYGASGGAIGIMLGLVLLAVTVVVASARFEGAPSRRQIGLTCKVALALFAIGAGAHVVISVGLPPSAERSWVDVLVTLSSVGVTGILFGRKLLMKVKLPLGDQDL